MIKIIACVGKNNELGANGDLCFHIKDDMRFFRQTTEGYPVLMGYRTWLSLGEKPLPNRRNFVLTRTVDFPSGNVIAVPNLQTFLRDYKNNNKTLFVIGGASVYAQTIRDADELLLTEVDSTYEEADVFFPEFDKKSYHKDIIQEGVENGLAFVISKYAQQ